MKEYHKINSIFKRDKITNKFLIDEWSNPEFEYLKYNDWIWEEKIDGTNIRIIPNKDKVLIKGKTDNANLPTFLLEKLQTVFNIEKVNSAFNLNTKTELPQICLYGEGCGERIQKHGGIYTNNNGVDFILFDIKINNWWLKRDDVKEIATKLDIRHSIEIGYGTLIEAIELVKHGFKSNYNSNFLAEGLVMRPKIELFNRSGNRIITKVKHKDFI